MPGGDRTGPWGTGPMTGRGLGFCAGYTVPGYIYAGPGRWLRGFGRGLGRGRGRGRRAWWGPQALACWQWAAMGLLPLGARWLSRTVLPHAPTRQQQLEELNEQAESLENALHGIRARINQLEAEPQQNQDEFSAD
jgi:hypothetical protein